MSNTLLACPVQGHHHACRPILETPSGGVTYECPSGRYRWTIPKGGAPILSQYTRDTRPQKGNWRNYGEPIMEFGRSPEDAIKSTLTQSAMAHALAQPGKDRYRFTEGKWEVMVRTGTQWVESMHLYHKTEEQGREMLSHSPSSVILSTPTQVDPT